ncbi:MAG: PilZ domain-containing protein [Azoarcus sp.]|uniref:PilZ domain-containing protein n=1 Tax=Parazoarcus communis TaxID=41977 RepID=A0A2U8GQG0_9RHOO|nr:PilZ domain-containing protein [Parazoarcus communis]AWI75791.1 PilZ domain-containing protein [Parazoarcus communis]PLX69329.1 MAG: PilZ domain-containing protein [Azoarcus sp.]TVT56990.1 MAG: PilZ domain-containing protein [Azoarcus sp. PHD]|tara:strand:- start:7605 stop:7913 length:309 start_codon:yes stop_codon:yes gene_type:complete
MNDHVTPPDRRLDRRIPLGCAASILLGEGRSVAAECIELSVSGMTLHAAYVPGELEVIDVAVMSPGAGLGRPPLVTRLKVTRCHAIGGGRYEIGGAITQVVG